MRILILGGTGMLGHKLWQVCRERFDAWVTVRDGRSGGAPPDLFPPDRTIAGVDAEAFDTVQRAVETVGPEAIVNCIGVVKQVPAAADPVASIASNALLPHRLARLAASRGARLIQISTDCVFSGRRGCYTEDDRPDADDLYGRSKALGEVDGPGALTLRTSMIGRQLRGSYGLVEWLLGRRHGRVPGYTAAFFSGLTTSALATVIVRLLAEHPDLAGVHHVAADRISKFAVLELLKAAFGLEIEIEPDPTVRIDRSLAGDRFRRRTGIQAAAWPAMIAELASDPTPYDRWRGSC